MLAQKAEHDALTGLMNRRAYDDLTTLLKNAVIMTDVSYDDRDVLEDKVHAMNRMLAHPEDSALPPVSLSVGAAFSDHGFRDDLFSLADHCLYSVKKSGGCGCQICRAEDEEHTETN